MRLVLVNRLEEKQKEDAKKLYIRKVINKKILVII